jgi:hypothetical protein
MDSHTDFLRAVLFFACRTISHLEGPLLWLASISCETDSKPLTEVLRCFSAHLRKDAGSTIQLYRRGWKYLQPRRLVDNQSHREIHLLLTVSARTTVTACGTTEG